MPVTARLSRRLHERLGDEIANELVDWLNTVDEPYRSQIRELNELNREWFRAELANLRIEIERRFGQVDARLAEQRAELLKWMFVFWTATVVPLSGLIVALSDVFRS